MQYEDRVSIPTPEGVTLELALGGAGSRLAAGLVDQLIQTAIIGVLSLAALAGVGGGGPLAAAIVVVVFLVQFGYHVLFETLGGGRTPGKRWTGLRVVKEGGGPVGFTTSAVRNLLRLVDALPGLYAVGLVAVLASPKNQRLGDMAAGTLVVRERRGGRAAPSPGSWAPPRDHAGRWDVSAVTAEEVSTVRRFLDRRPTLTPEARRRLADELAARLRPKVVGPADDLPAESFLEELTAAKSDRR